MNDRKNTWRIYSLSLITKHTGTLPLVQGTLEITDELSVTAHRTKPALAASSEPMGEFHTILYLPVRRHTYRMAERRQLHSKTAVLSGIFKKSREAYFAKIQHTSNQKLVRKTSLT